MPVPAVDAAVDSISKRTGASPVARFIFSVFDTNGHSCSGDAWSSHTSVYVWTSEGRTIGGAGCAVISTALPPHSWSIAAASSTASCGRVLGSFARQRATISATAGDASGTSVASEGGGSRRCWRITPSWLSSLTTNGGRPAISANRQQPSA